MPKTSTSFKAGDPKINRDGAPKKEWTMAGLYREAAEEMDATGVPKKVIIARKLVSLAAKGDVVAIKEIGNRLDGMPTQNSNVNVAGEMQILVDVKPTK